MDKHSYSQWIKIERIELDLIRKIDITDVNLAKEVLNIQIPAYQVEAELIGFDKLPPLKDTIETLQQSGEKFYGYYIKEELSGVLSLKIENGVMDIHRLFVHPKHFRKGISQTLIDFVQSSEAGYNMITVATGTKNVPAVHFYHKNGFNKLKEIIVEEGLSISLFEKRIR